MSYPQSNFVKGAGLYTEHIQGAQAVPAYRLVYIDGNGQWALADASTALTMPVVGLATEPLSVNQRGRVLHQGWAASNTWTWVPGAVIYASDTAGELSQVAGTVAQVVGIAVSTTMMYFDGAGLIADGAISVTDLFVSGTLNVDTINEFTLNAGVTIEGVLIENGAFTVDTDTATGDIAEPVVTPIGDGHMVKVLYTDYAPDRVVLWIYDLTNTTWHGVEML